MYQFLIPSVVAVGGVGCAKHILPVVSHGAVGDVTEFEVGPVVTKNGFVRVPIAPIVTNSSALLKARPMTRNQIVEEVGCLG